MLTFLLTLLCLKNKTQVLSNHETFGTNSIVEKGRMPFKATRCLARCVDESYRPERYRCGLFSRMGTDLEELLKRKDKTMKVEARVEKEPGEKNFSCYMHIDSLKAAVLGTGSSAKAAIKDMLNGWHLFPLMNILLM